jgi:hypothetical protein
MCACERTQSPPIGASVYDQKYDQTLQYCALPCTFMLRLVDLRGRPDPEIETVNPRVTGSSPVSGASQTW